MIKLFLDNLKTIATVVGFALTVIAAYAYFEGIKDAALKKEDIQEIVREQISPIINRLDSINYNLEIVQYNQGVLFTNQQTMKNTLVKEFKDENKIDEVIKLLDQFKNTSKLEVKTRIDKL